MRILSARRLSMPPGRSGFTPIARFDLEPVEGVTVMNCSLVRAPDGRTLVYGPPSKNGDTVLHMAPTVRAAIIEQALVAAGIDANERAAA